jgi:hypothetical protein
MRQPLMSDFDFETASIRQKPCSTDILSIKQFSFCKRRMKKEFDFAFHDVRVAVTNIGIAKIFIVKVFHSLKLRFCSQEPPRQLFVVKECLT